MNDAGMSIRRIAYSLLGSVMLLAFLPMPPADAQQGSKIGLTLLSQTPWITPKSPTLTLQVQADNESSTAFDRLSVGVTIGTPALTQIDYTNSLSQLPSTFPLDAQPFAESGSLEPGESRTFPPISIDLSRAVSSAQTYIYPMQLDLRSGIDSLASVFTPVISFIPKPLPQLKTQWTIELSWPITYLPDGTFANTSLQEAISPHTGSLAAEVAALHAIETGKSSVPVDLVISPALISQLRLMAAGYRVVTGSGTAQVAPGSGGSGDASAMLSEMRDIVANSEVELSALPLMDPSVPSLLHAGLNDDVTSQVEAGAALIRDALGVSPDRDIVRPSEGALDEQTLTALATSSSAVVLGNSDSLRPTWLPGYETLGFAPQPTGLTETTSGTDVPVVLPDPVVQTMLATTPDGGPVAQAQQVLGELLAIWQERPNPQRAIAMNLPSTLPPGIWGQLLPRIASAPFLSRVDVADLLAIAPPPDSPSRITAPTPSIFSEPYLRDLRVQQEHIGWLRSMLSADAASMTNPLANDVYAAESSGFVTNENKGRAFIDQVNAVTRNAFRSTRPLPGQEFTFTSGSGTIVLQMGDPGNLSLHVTVELQSSKLAFPDGSSQVLTLDHPNQIAAFHVIVKATGLIQVTANVLAPDGRIIRSATFFVRSTAYNKIALLITALAALILVILWARRIFKRPA